jgi:hypothetical protein
MFSLIRKTFQQWARSGTRAGAQREPVRHLQVESLEDRNLLSLTGSEFLVNSTLSKPQYEAAVASSPIGRSIVVWTNPKAPKDYDIKGQIFDSSGHKIGKEITIAGSREHEHTAAVAMDAKGNFVVVWEIDFTSTDKDIRAARFRADGTKIGSEFRVAWSYRSEYDPDIAMASNGDFIISYTMQYSGSDTDVFAKMYSASASLRKTITIANSSKAEAQTSVAAAPDGRFDVAYVMQNNIYLQRFNKSGSRLGTTTVIATSKTEVNPDVAMDSNGNAIVAWQVRSGKTWDIQARRVSSSGSLSSVINIRASAYQETAPTVSIATSGSKFVVAYQSDSASTKRVQITEVSASNSIVRTSTITGLTDPSISMGPNSTYFVVANSLGSRGSDHDGGIFGRLGRL